MASKQFDAFLDRHALTIKLLAAALVLYSSYIFFSSLVAAYQRRQLAKARGCQPCASYKHAEPFYGLDLTLATLKGAKEGVHMRNTQRRFKEVGSNTFSSLSNGARIINTIEPENIKAVLATQFKDFAIPARRINGFLPFLGEGIFSTNGVAWEHSRALLRPNFARSQVADLDTFETHVTNLIKRIPKDGSTIDLQKLFFMLTIDSATEFLFGKSTNTLDDTTSDEDADRFADAFNYAQDTIATNIRLGALARFNYDSKYEADKKYVHAFVDSFVAKAVAYRKSLSEKHAEEEGEADRYIFLQELAKTNASEREMRNELINILIAGRDTTASLLSHFFFTLARRPDVVQKLRQEIGQLKEERPTFETIKDMKYLRYCMNEALRLFPVVPANTRAAVTDTTLPMGGGPDGKSPVFLKKNELVTYSVFAMQRRKDLYGDDAEEFKPERWEKLRPGWEYLPFNGGPRICLGQQFALTEASYTTIRLLQAFKKVEPRDDSEWLEQLTLTMSVKTGVQVSLTPA